MHTKYLVSLTIHTGKKFKFALFSLNFSNIYQSQKREIIIKYQ